MRYKCPNLHMACLHDLRTASGIPYAWNCVPYDPNPTRTRNNTHLEASIASNQMQDDVGSVRVASGSLCAPAYLVRAI